MNTEGIIYVPIETIQPGENRFPELEEDLFAKLLESIRDHGILEPLHVKEEGNKYILLQGHQRYKAAQKLGIKFLPCIVVKTQSKCVAAEFDTNLYRRHLSRERFAELEEVRKKLFGEPKLIPEFSAVKEILPKHFVELIASQPKDIQLKFYRALPQKIVENTKLKEELERKLERIQNQINEKNAKIDALQKKIQEFQNRLQTAKMAISAKKSEIEVIIAKKVEEKRKELEQKYASSELQAKIEQERQKIEEECKKRYEKEIEEQRKIAVEQSQARSKLENQLNPLKEEVKKLQQDIERYKQDIKRAEETANYAKNKLKQFIQLWQIPKELESLATDLSLCVSKIVRISEIAINLGATIHQTKDENVKALAKAQQELKRLVQSFEDLTKFLK